MLYLCLICYDPMIPRDSSDPASPQLQHTVARIAEMPDAMRDA